MLISPGDDPAAGQLSRWTLDVGDREAPEHCALRLHQAVEQGQGLDVEYRVLLSGGGEAEKSGWFTLVWVRTPEGWRAVHDHSS